MLSEDVRRATEIARVLSLDSNNEIRHSHLLAGLLLVDEWTRAILGSCGAQIDLQDLAGKVKDALQKHQNKPLKPEFLDYINKLDNEDLTKPMDVLKVIIKDAELANELTLAGVNIQSLEDKLSTPEMALKAASDMLFNKFCEDMTKKVEEGEYHDITPREKDIEKLINVLSRKGKNNVLITGKSGVGKTSMIIDLCHRIQVGDVPNSLLNKKLLEVSIPELFREAGFRGAVEGRMDAILTAMDKRDDIILVLDNMGVLINLEKGGNPNHVSGILSMLRRHLDKHNVKVIAVMNDEEVISIFDGDPAAKKKFQHLCIEEPTNDEAKEIIENLIGEYVEHHNVNVSTEMIDVAIRMANRYIKDKALPEKAIEIIDEAMATASIESEKLPIEDKRLKELKNIDNEIISNIDKNKFKGAINALNKADSIRDAIDKEIETNIVKLSERKIFLDRQHIMKCISRWTGIPVGKLSESDRDRLLGIDTALKRKVIGQDEAIKIVSKAIKRSGVNLKRDNTPIGCFMFTGPSGVGKTELSRRMAEYLYHSPNSFLRLDMSEFSQEFHVTRLIGASPGYIGYGKGGQLTNHVKKYPYSLILFDEIEKAHPNLYNILLQIMDAGRLTDASGNEVDFSNTIIVMTTNLGLKKDNENKGALGFIELDQKTHDSELSERADRDLKRRFNAEFVNRLDAVVKFKSLNKDKLLDIVDIQVEELNEYMEKHETPIKVKLLKNVKEFIVDKAIKDEEHPNARPLKRVIEVEIEDKLAEYMVSQKYPKDQVTFKYINNSIEIS